MAKVLITGMKTYSFKKDDSDLVEGAKISYLTEFSSTKDSEFGFLPLQTNVKLELANKEIKDVPGIYDLQFEIGSGKNNTPVMNITGFKFIKSVDFTKIFEG